MKNKIFITILNAFAIFALISCSEDIIDNESLENEKTIISTVTSHYIIDGISYPVTVVTYSDNTVETINELDPILEEVLNESTSTLLVDPLNENTFYAFRSEEESMPKNAEIITKLNEYESQLKDVPVLKSGVYGSVRLYSDINYWGYMNPTHILLTTNGSISQLVNNDQLSSYYVLSNTIVPNPSDGERFVIRFYENANFGGRVLTAYSFFMGTNLDSDYHYSWQDSNMHNTLRRGGLFKLYWGDCVSSIRWTYESGN